MTEVKNEPGGLDWNNFDDEDGDFSLGEIKPVDTPKACSISDGDCEACQ
jgi:hypothetical protein